MHRDLLFKYGVASMTLRTVLIVPPLLSNDKVSFEV